jgi:hypothetical protein
MLLKTKKNLATQLPDDEVELNVNEVSWGLTTLILIHLLQIFLEYVVVSILQRYLIILHNCLH